MKSFISTLCLALTFVTLSGTTLTDTQGRSIEVDILEVGEDSVEVRRSDGDVFDIPFSMLSEESKKRLLKSAKSDDQAYDFGALNELLDLKLWKDANLWDDPVDEVAQALGHGRCGIDPRKRFHVALAGIGIRDVPDHADALGLPQRRADIAARRNLHVPRHEIVEGFRQGQGKEDAGNGHVRVLA